MKKRKIKPPVKPFVGAAVIILLLFVAVVILKGAARNSRLFVVREVIIRENPDSGTKINLSYLTGRDILALDLKREELNIARAYPGYSRIKLIKVFPDRLFAYFIRRKPLAAVKLNRYFYVDASAVLFDPPDAAAVASIEELPAIYGLNTKIFGPKVGMKYNARELLLGVNIIKAVKNNRQLRGLKIKRIDVTNAASASFLVSLPVLASPGNPPDEGIEVKIGQDYIADKINILASMLIQGRNDWDNIKYIDLRFKEPVIKFKDKTKKNTRL